MRERLSDQKSAHNIKSYDVSQWRFAKEAKHNGEDLFYIVLNPLIWISIYKYLTLEEFLDNYQRDVTLYVQRIEVVNDSIAPCFNCGGKGKKDWVERAVRSANHPWPQQPFPEFSIIQAVKHYRVGNERRPGNVDVYSNNEKPQYVTTVPKLNEDEEMCNECFGCGFALRQERRGNIYYWNDLNIFYLKLENPD